jgi:radical SAM superfamily enzyme YgiQ (UPF0313 family)
MKIAFISTFLEMPGIEHLSAMLRQKGHHTRLFVPREFLTFVKGAEAIQKRLVNREAILRRLREDRYDLVGFSVLSDDYPWALQFARAVKESSDARVIMGNVHVTSTPESVISHDAIDAIVVGEGDHALVEYVEALQSGDSELRIPNLWARRDGEIIRNPVRPLIGDLDALPFPDKELYYRELPYYRRDYIISTGRGCQYNCTYCCASVYRGMYRGKGRYYRRRSEANAVEELVEAKGRYGYGYVQFYDENLLYDLPWVQRFMEEYRRRIGVPFKCCGTVHHLSEEMVEALAKGGCKMISLGIQSASEEVRRKLRRTESNEQILQAVGRLRAAGIRVYVDHIFGFPFEPVSNQDDALAFYNRLRPNVISSYFLKYYPMTEMAKQYPDHAERAQREDTSYFSSGDVEDPDSYHRYHTMMSVMTFLPRSWVDLAIRHRVYRYLPRLGNLRLLGRIAGSSWKNEIQARRMFHTWLQVLFRKGLSYS